MRDDYVTEKDEGPSEADIARAEQVASQGDRRPVIPTAVWKALGIAGGLLIVGLLLGEALVFGPRRPRQADVQTPASASVVRVIDGATIVVEVDGEIATVRYIGVVVPQIGDAMAGPAISANRQWVSGKDVVLERDKTDTDESGNLLRYVYVDGGMVNAALIRAGLAKAAGRDTNDRYYQQFIQIEAQAKADRLGIWASAATMAASRTEVPN